MDIIKIPKWIYFVIYVVLLTAFIEVVEPSFLEVLILFGIIVSTNLYLKPEDLSKEQKTDLNERFK